MKLQSHHLTFKLSPLNRLLPCLVTGWSPSVNTPWGLAVSLAWDMFL